MIFSLGVFFALSQINILLLNLYSREQGTFVSPKVPKSICAEHH